MRTKISEKRKFHDSTPRVVPRRDVGSEGRRWFWIRVNKLLNTSCANGKFTTCLPVAVAIIKNTIRVGKILSWRLYLISKEVLLSFALITLIFFLLLVFSGRLKRYVGISTGSFQYLSRVQIL